MFQNKAIVYAILSVAELAKQRAAGRETGIQAGEVAARFGLPTAYAAKVMSQLARSRLLRSDRGPRGGFQLARAPQDITLLEVIEAVGGNIDGRLDAEQSGAPEGIRKGLAHVYGLVTDRVREVLGGVTVSQFAEKYLE